MGRGWLSSLSCFPLSPTFLGTDDANLCGEGPRSPLLLFVLYHSEADWMQKERNVS